MVNESSRKEYYTNHPTKSIDDKFKPEKRKSFFTQHIITVTCLSTHALEQVLLNTARFTSESYA